MGPVTKDLVLAGWRVEAEGKLIRPAGEFKLALSTGIDWFDLDGGRSTTAVRMSTFPTCSPPPGAVRP